MDSYCISENSGKYAGKSEKLTVFLSPLSYLSTQTAKEEEEENVFLKMAVIVTKKEEGNRNLKHNLFICFLFYQIDTSNTSRVTFTKSGLQSIKP